MSGSGSPLGNVTGIVRAGRAGMGLALGVYRVVGAGDIAVGVGPGLLGTKVVPVDEDEEAIVCGETEPVDCAPPSPGLGMRRPPVCIRRRARRAVDMQGRDIVKCMLLRVWMPNTMVSIVARPKFTFRIKWLKIQNSNQPGTTICKVQRAE